MARNLCDEITFVVRNGDGRVIYHPKSFKFAEARKKRKELEEKYPFPENEILELVTEEKEYILSELETPQVRWSHDSRAKIQKDAQQAIEAEEVAPEIKLQLLEKLKTAVSDQDISKIETIGEEIEKKYDYDELNLKIVALAYCNNDATMKRGIELLESLAKKRVDADLFSALAEVHTVEQQWEKAALTYYRTGELETQDAEKAKNWNYSAYMFWLDHQHERAAEVAEKAMEIAKGADDPELLRSVKNALAYYWAEIGNNLDKGRALCLEMLGIPDDEHFVDEIQKGAFEGEKDAQIIDTLGRIVESEDPDRDVDAYRLYRKAHDISPDQPINVQNLERAYQKLKKGM